MVPRQCISNQFASDLKSSSQSAKRFTYTIYLDTTQLESAAHGFCRDKAEISLWLFETNQSCSFI
jgi:hypothetical protein